MNAQPKKVKESEVVSLHRPSGELRVRLTDVGVGDVVDYQGVAFTVSTISDREGEATAYPASLEELGDVEPWVLRLKPGDTIVLTSKVALSPAVALGIVQRAKEFFPGYPVLVLDSNVKIGRIRPDVGSDDQ